MRAHPYCVMASLLTGCVALSANGEPSADEGALGDRTSFPVALCLAGFGPLDHGTNRWFESLCYEIPNVIHTCAGNNCGPLFKHNDDEGALEDLIFYLDTDRDGRVTDKDLPSTVSIAGYSWGGFNAVDKVARNFLSDERVDTSRRHIDRVVVVDPFRLKGLVIPGELKVPEGVKNFWSFRHSKSPTLDCSADAIAGPYRGIRPTCPRSAECWDYDYSADANRSYSGRFLGEALADEIGHCRIVDVAYHEVVNRILHGDVRTAETPPRRRVQTYD